MSVNLKPTSAELQLKLGGGLFAKASSLEPYYPHTAAGRVDRSKNHCTPKRTWTTPAKPLTWRCTSPGPRKAARLATAAAWTPVTYLPTPTLGKCARCRGALRGSTGRGSPTPGAAASSAPPPSSAAAARSSPRRVPQPWRWAARCSGSARRAWPLTATCKPPPPRSPSSREAATQEYWRRRFLRAQWGASQQQQQQQQQRLVRPVGAAARRHGLCGHA